MTDCSLESSVVDWLIEHPETQPVLDGLGINSTCAGKSLAYLCRQRGLDPHDVMDRLLRCLMPQDLEG